MQGCGDVGRRNDNAVGGPVIIRFGVEDAAGFPLREDLLLELRGTIGFGEL